MANPVSSINVVAQIGQEATLGGGGSAGKRLQSLLFEVGREITTKEYTSQGYRLPTIVAQEMEWTSVKLTGEALYTELLYPIENVFGTVTPTLEGTQTQKRVYDLLPTGSITPKTNTLQFGDPADNVNTLAYLLMTGFGLKYDREQGVSISTGDAIAQKITTGGTFTASPTYMAKIPILGSEVNYYLDSTGASIGGTQILDEVLSCEWSITGIKGPRWVSDRAQPSFKGHVDLMPKGSVKMTLGESSVSRGIVTNLEAGATYFLRIDALGPVIETTYNYGLQTDIALQVAKYSAWKMTRAYGARTSSSPSCLTRRGTTA